MELMDFLVILLVAGVCGAIGQSIAGFSRGGCLVSIALCFIGSLLGVWIARTLNLPVVFAIDIGGKSFPIVWSIAGAAIFVAVLGFVSGRNKH